MAKKNLILLIVFVILAGAAFLFSGPFKSWNESRQAPKNFLSGVNIDQAEKIEMIRTEKTVTLTKDGGRWKVDQGKFYALPAAIEALKSGFKKAQAARLEVASINKDKLGDFDLTKEYATEVKIYQSDKVIADFFIGKMTSDYSGAFIGEPNGNNAYSVPVDLSSAFTPYEWRDLAMFNFSPDKITKLRFQYPDRQFTLEKKDGKWVSAAPSGFNANEEKVNAALSALSNLQAEAIPAQTFSNTDLDKHLIIVEANGSDGNYALMIGKDNGQGQFFAKRGDSDNIYLIAKASRDSFNKKAEDFK